MSLGTSAAVSLGIPVVTPQRRSDCVFVG